MVRGDLNNSQSLNRYCYVQGNPVSYTDPFGMSPYEEISQVVHAALDFVSLVSELSIVGAGVGIAADAINATIYIMEGDYANASLYAVCMIPVASVGVFAAKGLAKTAVGKEIVKAGKTVVTFLDDVGQLAYKGLKAADGKINQLVQTVSSAYSNVAEKVSKLWKKPKSGSKTNWEAHNVINYAKYKEVLRTTEIANPLIKSLRITGKLLSNYITKADAGVSNTVSSAKQAGTRLLYPKADCCILHMTIIKLHYQSVHGNKVIWRNRMENFKIDRKRYWIEKILNAEFKGKHFLEKQVLKSRVVMEQGYDYISLKFKTEEVEKYPYQIRVPVEMRAFQKNSAPIVFLLHVVNGYIDELELITADSSKIDSKIIELENVEYVINESVK